MQYIINDKRRKWVWFDSAEVITLKWSQCWFESKPSGIYMKSTRMCGISKISIVCVKAHIDYVNQLLRKTSKWKLKISGKRTQCRRQQWFLSLSHIFGFSCWNGKVINSHNRQWSIGYDSFSYFPTQCECVDIDGCAESESRCLFFSASQIGCQSII